MHQKMQGMVCLVIGGSLLALLIDPLSPINEQKQLHAPVVVAEGEQNGSVPKRERACSSEEVTGRVHKYSGWFKEAQSTEVGQWWKWSVEVLRVSDYQPNPFWKNHAVGSASQVIVRSTSQKTNSWGWVDQEEKPRTHIAWYSTDLEGTASKRCATPAPHAAIPSLEFFFSDAPLKHKPTEHLSEETISCEVLSMEKDVRFQWTENGSTIEHLQFHSRTEQSRGESICRGEISLHESEDLSDIAIASLVNQLAVWDRELREARRLYEMSSHGGESTVTSDGYEQLLNQSYARWRETLGVEFDSEVPESAILSEGFRQSLVEPGLVRHRLVEAHEKLAGLSDRGVLCLKPALSDCSDSIEWEKHQDRVVVLGFVARRLEGTSQILSVLERLRRDFPTDQLYVAACSTDHSEENLDAIRNVDGLSIPVVDGAELALQLELSSAGVPGILILDRHGRARGLHAWQMHSTYESLRCGVHGLLEEAPFSQSESLVQR